MLGLYHADRGLLEKSDVANRHLGCICHHGLDKNTTAQYALFGSLTSTQSCHGWGCGGKMHDPLGPGCRVLWGTELPCTRACREQSAMCCRCRLQLLDSVCSCRPALVGYRGWWSKACGIRGGGQGLDAAQDQQAGSNVREEASTFRWMN